MFTEIGTFFLQIKRVAWGRVNTLNSGRTKKEEEQTYQKTKKNGFDPEMKFDWDDNMFIDITSIEQIHQIKRSIDGTRCKNLNFINSFMYISPIIG